MTTTNQITPGMTLDIDGKIYRVESSMKVSAPKGKPFIKAKLRDLLTDKMIEKSFQIGLALEEVSLEEHQLEFLYPEKKGYLFLDIANLDQILVPSEILDEKINYLKEGISVRAILYKDQIFSVELPQFLELMVVKTGSVDEAMAVSSSEKKATLETGAIVEVPLFIETGDVIKVDTQSNEYIQRI